MFTSSVVYCTHQHGASIRAEEALGQSDTPDGGVIKRALKPLRGVGLLCIATKVPQLAAERAKTLAPHGVALVSHSRRANLVSLERLLKLLEHGQVSDVATDALGSATERAKSVEDVNIDLARVGLGSADLSLVEAGLLGDELVELLDKSVVALEDGKERSLGASRALDTTELVEEVVTSTLEVAEIVKEISDPERGTLANSHELGGLAVGVAKAGQ